ncbi:hypothetical protein BAY61_11040 [Prauserella marina]|uniref:Uncharacterized protein n=1 Tax=Prauserella marina TaxID=530584 RepID=A0A222VNE0_9PSEU|nr:hypothetical protein [Prauserella marina]ASR35446.1 hypothetical protein BAY61_11040 [Prauserella marina]PWV84742.1 hypothetical protein DES30_101760 [Prauserella marina]SDC14322.1 hypothetical protein SAMN05421630_101576 [Prauserella marina]
MRPSTSDSRPAKTGWRRAVTGPFAACAVLLLVAGCGQAGQDGQAGQERESPSAPPATSQPSQPPAGDPESSDLPRDSGKEPPETTEPAEPGAGAGAAAVPKAQLDGSGLPKGYPVDVTESADGRTLTVIGQEGGCSKASAEVAEQTAEHVALTMVETFPADKNMMCTMDMRYPPLTVELAEPLGDRHLALDYVKREE